MGSRVERMGTGGSGVRSGLLTATRAVLGTGLAGMLLLMLRSGEPGRPDWWLGALAFCAWAALPFGSVALAAGWMSACRPAAWVHLVAAVLLSAFGIWMLLAAFVWSPDPQGAVVLIFLPIYQLVGYLPFLLLATWLQRRQLDD